MRGTTKGASLGLVDPPSRPAILVLSPTCRACVATALELTREGLMDQIGHVYVMGRDPEAKQVQSALRIGAYPFLVLDGPNGPKLLTGKGPIVEAVKSWAGR